MKPTPTTFLADTFPVPFPGRTEVGKILAGRLLPFANQNDAVVAAIANDGVPVAAAVAATLSLPLTVEVIRRLGVPGQRDLVMGSLASDNVKVLDREMIAELGIPDRVVDWVIFCESQELERRRRVFARDRRQPDFAGATVILVDDGVGTGSRMLAAIQSVRKQMARRVVVAVPVGAMVSLARLRAVADQVVCLIEPKMFFSVSHWYNNFEPVEDWEVCQILDGTFEKTRELRLA